jgi:hypothetical protein
MRLLPLFGADGMDDISKEFAEFQRALREDPLLQEAIVKNSANHVSFVEGWVRQMIDFRCCKRFVEGWCQPIPILLQQSLIFLQLDGKRTSAH